MSGHAYRCRVCNVTRLGGVAQDGRGWCAGCGAKRAMVPADTHRTCLTCGTGMSFYNPGDRCHACVEGDAANRMLRGAPITLQQFLRDRRDTLARWERLANAVDGAR